ncbi:MAG: serine/threonine protein kinase [Bacteroidales bacterium]|nr:serine/threonine protein kinase [Bacteroidales bacterium]
MSDTNNAIYKELQPGTGLCDGKYIIEKKIGEGGFGITYRAVQSGLNRAVCIKEYFLAGGCIRDTYAKTIHLQGIDEDRFERFRKAFVKEAQTLAALHHQGIVEVIDIFDENNTSYMVMPFIEGRSLQSIVDQNGPLSYPEAVNYIAQVANAVGYIHDRHILHRDIKPDNIMITADFKAVLIDFGSAREFEEDKTQAQTSMVTHGYAPTEQYTRNSRKGAYTDIYAIGATLYFVLTGKVPYEAAARITEQMPEPKDLNPSLPPEANRTIMKAMQLKSQDRHQSIAEFMDDLRNVKPSASNTPSAEVNAKPQNAQPPKAEKSTTPQPAGANKKTKAIWIIIPVVVIVLASLVAVKLFLSNNNEMDIAIAEYNEKVEKCQVMIKLADGSKPEKLLQTRAFIDSAIIGYETKYAAEMPEVFNRSSELRKALGPKLKEAAKSWAEMAFTQVSELGDTVTACEFYSLSVKLFDDASIRDEASLFGCNL